MTRKTVVVGLLGTTLDRGSGPGRWETWRPSVAICQHDDLLVHRFELLHPERSRALAESVSNDIRQVSPETEVRLVS
jgi:transcriptional regulatory protein RtcR